MASVLSICNVDQRVDFLRNLLKTNATSARFRFSVKSVSYTNYLHHLLVVRSLMYVFAAGCSYKWIDKKGKIGTPKLGFRC